MLLGKAAGGLSASTIALLKEAWSEEHARWSELSVGQTRRLLLGRRHPCPGEAGGERAVFGGHHRPHRTGKTSSSG